MPQDLHETGTTISLKQKFDNGAFIVVPGVSVLNKSGNLIKNTKSENS